MKRVLILLCALSIGLLVGCQTETVEDFEFQYKDNSTLDDFVEEKEESTPEVVKEPETPKEPEVPQEGTLEFNGQSKTTLPIIDESVEVEMKVKGEMKYKITDGIVKGNGKGDVEIKMFWKQKCPYNF